MENDGATQRTTEAHEPERRPEEDNGTNAIMRKEMELLRRERDILERELRLEREGRASQRGASVVTSDNVNRSMTIGVKAISELLGEFDGNDNTFWKWEEQVRMLQTAY